MSRFALEVVDAVVAVIGADKTALRLSPGAYFNMTESDGDKAVFDYLLPALETRNLAYLHVGIFDDSMRFASLGDKSASEYMRGAYKGTLVGVGSYSFETANQAIDNNQFDLIAIGRPFIANPDYISKVKNGEALTPYSDEMLAELI